MTPGQNLCETGSRKAGEVCPQPTMELMSLVPSGLSGQALIPGPSLLRILILKSISEANCPRSCLRIKGLVFPAHSLDKVAAGGQRSPQVSPQLTTQATWGLRCKKQIPNRSHLRRGSRFQRTRISPLPQEEPVWGNPNGSGGLPEHGGFPQASPCGPSLRPLAGRRGTDLLLTPVPRPHPGL